MRSPWLAPVIGAVPVLAMAAASEVTRWLKHRRARRHPGRPLDELEAVA